MILINIIIFNMSFMDMDSLTHLMLSMFDLGEEFRPLHFVGLLQFYGSSLGSSDFVLNSMCGRSHSPCSGLFSC